MTTSLKPVITSAGLAAVFNASSTGLQAEISHIALGDGVQVASRDSVSLVSERNRVPVLAGERTAENEIHLSALENGSLEYWVREVGFYLSDGTLFAVWADETAPLAWKADGVDLLLGFDLLLTALPVDSVTVAGGSGDLSFMLAGELADLSAAIISGEDRSLAASGRLDTVESRLAVLETTVSGLRAYLKL